MDMPVSEFAAADAKARFSELLARAERGEAITIKRHGRAVARLVPPDPEQLDSRKAKFAEFLEWRRANIKPYPGRINYKEMIDAGRR